MALPGVVRGVEVVGGCGRSTYVADGWAGLRVIDADTPTSRSAAGFMTAPSRALGTEGCREYAYVEETPEGVEIVQDCETVVFGGVDEQ